MADWRAFPGAGAPRVFVGPGDTVKRALGLYAPYSARARAFTAVLRTLPDALARRLLAAVRDPAERGRLDAIATRVRELLGEPRAVVSIAPGTPGPHRKATAQITVGGTVMAYAKVATSDAARLLVRREHAVLVGLAAGTAPCTVPRILAFGDDDDATILVQQAAPAGAQPLPARTDARAAALATAIAGLTPGRAELQQLLPRGEPTDGVRREAHRCLAARFAGRPLPTGFGHGDFAPWNLRRLPDGSLYAFDWEYGGPGQPVGDDLLHYRFMPAVLVRRLDPRRAVASVLDDLATDANADLLRQLGVDPADVAACFLLYLLRLDARGVGIGGAWTDYLGDCLHHVLVRLGHSGTRPRVLVAAYACEPGQGSEPGVGWQMAQAISEHHEAWVVTRANNRAVIEQELAARPNPHLHFVYLDLPRWASFWKKGGRGVRTYYYLWQLLAARRCRELLRTTSLDLAHHVTFVNDWLFTFLALLPLPFMWGPLGSNPLLPAPFVRSWRQWLRDRLRHALQQVLRRADPLYGLSLRRAGVIGLINDGMAKTPPFDRLPRDRLHVHTAIGVESLPAMASPAGPLVAGGLRVVSIGKLIPIKGFHLALPAFARLHAQQPGARLRIIGDGPERASLTDLTSRLGLDDAVTFAGWLARDAVLEVLRSADVLLFPSGEGGGMVVLEAMGMGIPVVCLDFGGPGSMVGSDDCGQRVPLTSRNSTVAALGDALLRYANDPPLRQRHGEAARRRVQAEFLWEQRGRQIGAWYAALLGGSPRPDQPGG